MRQVGWGIAGFGWVARDYARPAIVAAGDRIVGIADPSSDARATAIDLGLTAHNTIDALLADPSLDALYVATPNDGHREIVERAARAGKAVLCEKPMAASLADAQAMADIVRETGVLYGTAFDQRHHPAHATLRHAIAEGAAGTITAIRIVYACWLDRLWSPEGQGTHPNWRTDRARAGGGALMDLAPHGLDLVQFLLDEPIIDIAALTQSRVHDYDVDDGALLIGRTESGVLISLHVAYNHPDTLPRRRLEIVGTSALFVATDTMGQEPGGQLVRTDAATAVSTQIVFQTEHSPFERQMRAFADALRNTPGQTFDVERDLHTMRLLGRAYESAACR
jgi:predicted dehydrogenase